MTDEMAGRGVALAGLLVVDKPIGWSSMDVVRRVRRAAGGAKTGHCGTLDPLATGVVVCCLGSATRQVDRLMGMAKRYEAEVDLSAFTATDDREGAREEVAVATPPDEAAVRAALAGFIGLVEQVPPAFSAVHVDGERAYKLARKGKPVTIAARTVRIDGIELVSYRWPMAQLRIDCGKGTYIRSLARDLGKVLGTGGHLAALRRTAVGVYDLSIAVTEERLSRPIGQGDLLAVPGPG
ncbi:MAG: tRNA pseudouridine(55) synthase TruB [Planctomycetes bacterium]|nr:tRNA pseudouridine(55) synthase TruB [Planctomycetota bacterium]